MKQPPRRQTRYALAGTLLGACAPAGALLWRVLLCERGALGQRLALEWTQSGFFYVYMAVGTVAVFALFGSVLGKKTDSLDRAKARSDALAVTDGLTALYNHRYLHDHLKAEFGRAERYQTSLTCLMLDIDNFKAINDAFGHLSGDQVLRVIARVIREQVRRVDTAGRYGGEEFLILMPHTTAAEALPVAERIRAEVQDFPFRFESRDARITLSIGLATYDGSAENFSDKDGLLKAADDALYRAKKRGKNQACLWTAESS